MTASGGPPALPRVWLLGVPVDVVSAGAALERAVALASRAGAVGPALALTPNPEMVVAARRDPALRAVLSAADLALPDGVGLVWALRRCGVAVPGRVPGVELMQGLLERAAALRWPVYLLGGRPGVAAEAAARAVRRWPDLVVAGTAHGYFPPEAEGEVVAAVACSGARVLFVGMGAGRQERFLYGHRGELGDVRLAMAVGGSLDVLAGRVRRAPAAVRRLGLEWLWRLVREPRRWRRQLALPQFVWQVLRAGRAAVEQAPGP